PGWAGRTVGQLDPAQHAAERQRLEVQGVDAGRGVLIRLGDPRGLRSRPWSDDHGELGPVAGADISAPPCWRRPEPPTARRAARARPRGRLPTPARRGWARPRPGRRARRWAA